METWPVALPAPSVEMTASPDAGLYDPDELVYPAPSCTYPPHTSRFSWFFDSAEMLAFRIFVDVTLNNGSALFTADWLELFGYDYHRARIVEYAPAHQGGGYWVVEAEIEIRAGIPLTDAGAIDYGAGLAWPDYALGSRSNPGPSWVDPLEISVTCEVSS